MTKQLLLAIGLSVSPLIVLSPAPEFSQPVATILLILLLGSLEPSRFPTTAATLTAPPALFGSYLLSRLEVALWWTHPVTLAITAFLVIRLQTRTAQTDKATRKKADRLGQNLKGGAVLRDMMQKAGQKETVTEAAEAIVATLTTHYDFDYATILLATKRNQLVLKGTTAPKKQVKTIEIMAAAHLETLRQKDGKALIISKKSCARCPHATQRGVTYGFFIPFKEKEKLIGAILVENKAHKDMESKVEEGFFTLIVDNIHLLIKNAAYQEEILRRAMTDHLTGAYNRSYLDAVLPRKLEEYHHTGKSFVIAMLDIDHFKAFNDTYGHAFGDLVLKEFAAFFQKSIRPDANGDIFFRYGGEEFTMFLADVSAKSIINRMDKLRQELSKLNFTNETGTSASITASFGLAEYPASGNTVKELLENADKALYQAKEEGRNRLVVYAPRQEKEPASTLKLP